MQFVRSLLAVWVLSLAAPGTLFAGLTIEITEGAEGALPIAIVPFGWQGGPAPPPQQVSAIISSDLARSGRFAPLAEGDLIARPHTGDEVNFRNWRVLGVENLVIGTVRDEGQDRYVVQFQLFDVFKGEQLTGYSIPSSRDGLRRTAHHISDIIYEQLTGQRGAFATRVAYISVTRKGEEQRYRLNVADADGYNEQTVLDSPSPLMSPAWSPDGRRLSYVSFEGKRSRIYVQDVATGTREVLSQHPGINGAPAWSPDGKRVAMTLSKDGNPEIYVMNLAGRTLQRITRSSAIDTEPAWTPDGRSLVFTSSRGGRPQIYRVAVGQAGALGRPSRVTFEGDYNARASFSPDGKHLTMVHGNAGVYRIGVLNLDNGQLRVLTDSALDESPSFAPNGSMIIYATNVNDRGVLSVVSVDGRVQQRAVLQTGDVREPAWSPFEG